MNGSQSCMSTNRPRAA